MSIKSRFAFASFHPVAARRVVLAAVSAAALSLGAVSAQAQNAESRIAVNLAGLNLAKSADAKKAYGRLSKAARLVCGPAADPRDLRARRDFEQCYGQALANAVSDVNNANLSALYESDDTIRIAQSHSRG